MLVTRQPASAGSPPWMTRRRTPLISALVLWALAAEAGPDPLHPCAIGIPREPPGVGL